MAEQAWGQTAPAASGSAIVRVVCDAHILDESMCLGWTADWSVAYRRLDVSAERMSGARRYNLGPARPTGTDRRACAARAVLANDFRNGARWWHDDPAKWLIRALHKVGLTDHLRRASAQIATPRRAAGVSASNNSPIIRGG
jgi:hypothetical protein